MAIFEHCFHVLNNNMPYSQEEELPKCDNVTLPLFRYINLIREPGIVDVVFKLLLLAGVLFKYSINDFHLHVIQNTVRGGAGLIQREVWVQQTFVA